MKDLIRLHVFNMVEYDAVAYLDTDINIVGDVLPVLDCAASGEFIMAQGLVAPLNAGVMVLKPNVELYKMSMWFAANADFSQHPADILAGAGGWGGGGAWPAKGGWPYFGFECGQGFLWALLYGNSNGTAHNTTSTLDMEAHEKHPLAMPYVPLLQPPPPLPLTLAGNFLACRLIPSLVDPISTHSHLILLYVCVQPPLSLSSYLGWQAPPPLGWWTGAISPLSPPHTHSLSLSLSLSLSGSGSLPLSLSFYSWLADI
jgi:hypothetical protein